MSHNVPFIPLALVVPALFVFGQGPAAGPSITPTHSVTAQEQPVPSTTQMTGICGLTSTDVADIIDYYDFDADTAAVSDAVAAPFDCDAYGDLCDALDETDAHSYVCAVWGDLEAEDTPQAVRNAAIGRIQAWGEPCEPSDQACVAVCGARDVLDCDGFLLGSVCVADPSCGTPVAGLSVRFFEFLGAFPEDPPTT